MRWGRRRSRSGLLHWGEFIAPAPGSADLVDHSSIVERFLVGLAVSRSARTAARVWMTLRGLSRFAVRSRRLQRRQHSCSGADRSLALASCAGLESATS
jgi:hypothetical protein